jgi:lipoate-protein ligase A
MHWRFLLSPPSDGASNMALDQALMDRARVTGEWTLRLYTWSEPTLSFGRNQTARDGYDLQAIRERGIGTVRRPTGGRAILHHRELTYSVTGPATIDGASVSDAGKASGGLRESYARINRLLLEGLRALGAEARVVEAPPRMPGQGAASVVDAPGLTPCFHHPSAGELVLGDRKLVGSAQWRCDGALLQHGSILVDDDQVQITSLLAPSHSVAPVPKPATLREALGHVPSPGDVAAAFFAAIQRVEDVDVEPIIVDSTLASAAASRRAQYLDPAWTWRR